jgi:phage baseplate assembly protein W
MAINQEINIYGRESKPGKFSAKSKSTKDYGFTFPFGAIEDGKFLMRGSDLELIKSNLRQLLLTNKGERVMLPKFGTNLRNYLMEPIDQALLSQIRRDILESIYLYAPNVNLLKLQVLGNDNPTLSGGHAIEVKLYCALKEDANTSFEIKVEIS